MTTVNRAYFNVSNSPGISGDVTVGAAVTGPYRTLGAAHDGMVFDGVCFTQSSDWEIRNGCTYTHGTTTLSRGTLEDSSSGSSIDLATGAKAMIVQTAGYTMTAAQLGMVRAILAAPVLTSLPTRETATLFRDVSGNGADLTPEASNANAFSVAGYATTTAAANGGLAIPQAAINWNPYSESLGVLLGINGANPAATATLLSIGELTGGGSTSQGMRISLNTSGAARVTPVLSATAITTMSYVSGIAGGSVDKLIAAFYDAPSGSIYMYANGVLVATQEALMTGANAYPDQIGAGGLRVGQNLGAGAAAVAYSVFGLQVAKWTGGLPLGIARAVAKHREQPRVTLSPQDFE